MTDLTQEQFEYIIAEEGVYSNDSSDYGGETIYGISYRFNKHCKIFKLLHSKMKHSTKTIKQIIEHIEHDKQYRKYAYDFYNSDWKKYKLYLINDDQAGIYLYSSGVNIGMRLMIKLVQKSIGAKPDGRIGPKTSAIINWVVRAKGLDNLKERLAIALICMYSDRIDEAKKKTKRAKDRANKNKKFYRGWVIRAIRNINSDKLLKVKQVARNRKMDRTKMMHKIRTIVGCK